MFDPVALRAAAGDAAFARGEDYFRRGKVEIIKRDDKQVTARISGTELYRARLRLAGKRLEGECSCPAFDNDGFCKHLVATGLIANASQLSDPDGHTGDADARIRDYLRSKGLEALVAMVMDLTDNDEALFSRLDLASLAETGDGKDLEKRLRALITKATKVRGFLDYREIRGWAEGVETALDAIEALADGAKAPLAMALADLAEDRLITAIGSADDSDGHIGALFGRTRDIHLAASKRARPEPVQLARDLFERALDDDWGIYGNCLSEYADVLGKEGLVAFRHLATQAFEKRPKPTGSYNQTTSLLTSFVDFFLEMDGDTDGRIALRMRDLGSAYAYLALAEFCKAKGRDEQALQLAQDGLWVFEDDHRDGRLFDFVTDELVTTGRTEEALAMIWRKFEKRPDWPGFLRLREVGGAETVEQAIAIVSHWVGETKTERWGAPPADLLVSMHMHEGQFNLAWQAGSAHGFSAGMAERLARASEKTHPANATQVYIRQIELLVERSSGNYDEAYRLVKRLAGLQDKPGHAAYLASLKERWKRKRNFMKLLG